MKIKISNVKGLNEILLAIYIFLFPGLNWIFANNKIVLYAGIAIILILFLINNMKDITISKSFIVINLIMFLFFCYSFLCFSNSLTFQYLKDYILYGFITMLLFSKVKNYNLLLKNMSYVSLLVFILSIDDPFNGYVKYDGYMSYGLFCVLPSFVLFHIQRKYYNNKLFLPFEILSLVALLYANRNSILTCILSVFALDVFLTKSNYKKTFRYLALFFVALLALTNINYIVSFLLDITDNSSYAIRALANMLSGESNGLANRDIIWSHAFDVINKHYILGTGFSYFESVYAHYCHNILVDFIVSMGMFGFVFIIIITSRIINLIIKEKKNIFLIFILLIGILPLMFNNKFIAWKFFWMMLIYIFKKRCFDEKTG